MLKLSDLALRPDLQLGPMLVSPSRRLVEGPGGHANLEPLIMQVFLLLLDAGGKVVTRTELFDQCWGGVIVGDDSLNRAILKVRRTGAHVVPGLFEIETIPRTGYRLTGQILTFLQGADAKAAEARGSPISRRAAVVGGAVVATLAAAGLGVWGVQRSREGQQFNALMDQGERLLEFGDPFGESGKYFERAVALRPDNAKAQGLFAYSRATRADNSDAGAANSALLTEADRAALAALAIDPGEPNALLAQVTLQRPTLDFSATEDRLREILAGAPDNILAMRHLWNLMQCVGRSRDALALVERAITVSPLAAASHFPRAQLLWILGRNAEADRVIDQAIQYWPAHPYVRFARFIIFAFTSRPHAALAMLENVQTRPQIYTPKAVALWRLSLAAVDERSPASIAAARAANLDAARNDFKLSAQAVLALSALGEVDAAFEIVESLFGLRRPSNLYPQPVERRPARSTAWRFAPWLFTPPTAPLRADYRFGAVCDGAGLTEYWTKRRIKPDYQLGIV